MGLGRLLSCCSKTFAGSYGFFLGSKVLLFVLRLPEWHSKERRDYIRLGEAGLKGFIDLYNVTTGSWYLDVMWAIG